MKGIPEDTLSSIAEATVHRILWEMENGVLGYTPHRAGAEVSAPPKVTLPKPLSPTLASPDPTLTKSDAPSDSPPRSDVFPLQVDDAEAALFALKNALGECTRCGLHRGRNRLVFGEGNPRARLVFVGEGPGRDEDAAGRPFVGEAGGLLTRIIEAMGLSREDVYICNVVKCRPPNNRTPEESETRICGPFLKRQLAVIRPEVIVALGAVAASFLLESAVPISRIRGKFQTVDNIPMMPTFHPAYLLRNPGEKRAVWNDMQMVMERLGLRKPVK